MLTRGIYDCSRQRPGCQHLPNGLRNHDIQLIRWYRVYSVGPLFLKGTYPPPALRENLRVRYNQTIPDAGASNPTLPSPRVVVRRYTFPFLPWKPPCRAILATGAPCRTNQSAHSGRQTETEGSDRYLHLPQELLYPAVLCNNRHPTHTHVQPT